MKSKVLLIDPFCKNPKYESPNAKLGYASAILERAGIENEIIDFILPDIEDIKELSEYEKIKEEFFTKIKETAKDYKYIYINCEYGLLKTARDISKILDNNKEIIIGGTFINYLYFSNQLNKIKNKLEYFDYLSVGDPETDLLNIVQENMKYIKEKIGKTKIYNSGMVEELDSIPFPNWSKYNIDKYDGNLYLVASKSCSYNRCKFCDERLIWGNKFRYRDYKKIIEEIKTNIEKYNINKYFFWDASIAAYPYTKELCKAIIEEKIECKWTALLRADEVTEELAKLMKEAGCYSIEIGIESLNQKILDLMIKGEKVETIKKAIKILKKNGIIVEGSFLIGYYEDNKESILKTIEEAKKIDLDFYRWHNLELSASYLRENPNIIDEDWAELDMNYPNQFLHIKIAGHPGGYLDMHIVSKMGENIPKEYPDYKIGNLTIKEIHELTRKAIKETEDIMTVEGHNPYI